MNKHLKNAIVLLILLPIVLIINGCSLIEVPKPRERLAAAEVISVLEKKNSLLKTFKGLGGITIQNKHQFSKFRIAWAGEYPNRLRLIAMISGKPIETIASDGKYIYIKSHTSAHKLIKKRNRGIDLEKLISIPVKANDIVSILSGRTPICSYTYAKFEKHQDKNGYVIELSKNWKGIVQKIFLNDKKNPVGFEMIKNGKPLYKVEYQNHFETGGFTFPSRVLFMTKESTCTIKIDKSFINPQITPEIFKVL